jgi:CubicO group peptidase (beta-lactamase class C family)
MRARFMNVLWWLAAPLSAQRAAVPSDSAIRAIIKQRVDAGLSAGIVVGVLAPDGTRRVVAYGVSGTSRPLDGNTLFEIGSITKTFTAAVLADMAAHHELTLDDPVASLLPPGVTVPSRNGRQITLLDLATQSSGLPYMPTNFSPRDATNPYADYSTERLYAFLGSYHLTRDVGSAYEYSNVGVGLLAHALALRAGMDIETLYLKRILDPLGMTDTRIALTSAMRAHLALGHGADGAVVKNWDLGSLAGAGGLRSTANDMLVYLAANLAADVDSTEGVLASTLHATHVPRRPASGPAVRIGLAWHLLAGPSGQTITWHNGGTGGYRTFAGYDARQRLGIVVLTNSGIPSADDIGVHLLIPTVPLQPPAVVVPKVNPARASPPTPSLPSPA